MHYSPGREVERKGGGNYRECMAKGGGGALGSSLRRAPLRRAVHERSGGIVGSSYARASCLRGGGWLLRKGGGCLLMLCYYPVAA